MPTIYSNFPIVTCPHCGGEFQLDDYYDLETGDAFDCAVCDREIHILSLDTTVTARLATAYTEEL